MGLLIKLILIIIAAGLSILMLTGITPNLIDSGPNGWLVAVVFILSVVVFLITSIRGILTF